MIHLCHDQRLRNKGVRLAGLGAAHPFEAYSNEKLCQSLLTDPHGSSDEWIRSRTGIDSRYIATPDKPTSYWGIKAARQALERAGMAGKNVDMIVVATVSPDYSFPANASITQEQLAAVNASVHDVSSACSSFGSALHTGYNAIIAGSARHVLVIGSDNMSSLMNWNDRTTCVLFGDAAAAVVLTASENDDFHYFDIGGLATEETLPLIIKKAGGSAEPLVNAGQLNQGRDKVSMQGNAVFKQIVPLVKRRILLALNKTGFAFSDISFYAFHQANQRITDAVTSSLGIRPDQTYNNINRFGNTTSASVPLVLYEAAEKNLLHQGDKVMLVMFGAGFVWSIIILEWNL